MDEAMEIYKAVVLGVAMGVDKVMGTVEATGTGKVVVLGMATGLDKAVVTDKVMVLGMATGCSRPRGRAEPQGSPLSSLRLQVVSSSAR